MLLTQKSDLFGALASSLCLIHCLITPFIFVAQTCSRTCCDTAPLWWRTIDFIFLIVSFFAVYWSAALTTKQWLKVAFWASWGAFFFLLSNEHLKVLNIAHELTYVPSFALIALHFYNKKYCKCTEDRCCV
ncbi:MAG: MerC domain-containing protein [Aureispira sp.]